MSKYDFILCWGGGGANLIKFDQYVRTISICTDDFNMYVGGEGGGRGTDYHYTHKEGKRCVHWGGGRTISTRTFERGGGDEQP